ncbi:MAG: hypothetical protein OXF88_04715 [Rhodobacteraceae bacterium]|nr:hypothetical protein [Paracoccaceae bacterium]MCY4136883.1 hypothetical protein [Paracoccaceae bacterium]
MHYRNSRVGWARGLVAKVTGDLADPREFTVVPAGFARQAGTAFSDDSRAENQTPGILKCHKFASSKHMIGKTFHRRSLGLALPLDVTIGIVGVHPVICVAMGTFVQHLGRAGPDNP